ncbi:MAG: NAD+ synthase [Candidatus Gastranaerophilaceae bacterium]|jgi:NAD+ synthase (glutamine-hydrolysing)
MKIALSQINPKIGDLNGNIDKIISFIEKAIDKKADIIVFSELAITGYPPRDLLDFEYFVEDNIKQLEVLVKYSKDIAIICGFIDKNTTGKGKKYHNAAAFIYDGKIVHTYHKSLLPFYDVFDETRYFEPGKEFEPIEFKGKKIGLTICEDIWNDKGLDENSLYVCNPIEELAKKGVEFFINISASPYHLNKEKQRFNMISQIAKKHSLPVVYVNQVGANDDLLFDGVSFAVNKKGELISRCKDFEEDMTILEIDSKVCEIKEISSSEEESIFKALSKGLKDYCGKMGFKKVIIGLSGGIDSTLTAVIACDALGSENVLGITMPSMYSSTGSVTDSQVLAENLGMKCITIPIKPIFDSYINSLQFEEGVLMDLAEENLQARIRANILMMYSNRQCYLLLSTGNKSEMSVGYCTLYGDMAGGLNLLSDVPKTMVYRVSKYINRNKEIIPSGVIVKPPSAELRPDQKDQDTLPEYDVLDDILKMYVEEYKDPLKIAEKYPKELVFNIIKKINNNEYKRNQATLGLKVTTKAYGSGRRFPLVQGYDFREK